MARYKMPRLNLNIMVQRHQMPKPIAYDPQLFIDSEQPWTYYHDPAFAIAMPIPGTNGVTMTLPPFGFAVFTQSGLIIPHVQLSEEQRNRIAGFFVCGNYPDGLSDGSAFADMFQPLVGALAVAYTGGAKGDVPSALAQLVKDGAFKAARVQCQGKRGRRATR